MCNGFPFTIAIAMMIFPLGFALGRDWDLWTVGLKQAGSWVEVSWIVVEKRTLFECFLLEIWMDVGGNHWECWLGLNIYEYCKDGNKGSKEMWMIFWMLLVVCVIKKTWTLKFCGILYGDVFIKVAWQTFGSFFWALARFIVAHNHDVGWLSVWQ